MKKLKGRIGFHVATSNAGESPIPRVLITDELSGTIILEAELSWQDYAIAILANRHEVTCEISLNDSGTVGKKCQLKDETVWIPEGPWKKREETARAALKPFEVDESRCARRREQSPPGQQRTSEGSERRTHWYRIGFRRYVPVEE